MPEPRIGYTLAKMGLNLRMPKIIQSTGHIRGFNFQRRHPIRRDRVC
jgi:hypothetical protein